MNEMKGAKKFQVSKETLENSWWLLLSVPASSWGNRSQKYMWQWEGRESKFSTHVDIFIGKTSLCLNKKKKADLAWVVLSFTELIQKSLKSTGYLQMFMKNMSFKNFSAVWDSCPLPEGLSASRQQDFLWSLKLYLVNVSEGRTSEWAELTLHWTQLPEWSTSLWEFSERAMALFSL